jgi:hypothetical protein
VAVDSANVYWVAGLRKVSKVPLGGGRVTNLASDQNDPEAVAADGAHVFWVNFNGSVKEVSVCGGRVTTLVNAQGSAAVSVAVGP